MEAIVGLLSLRFIDGTIHALTLSPRILVSLGDVCVPYGVTGFVAFDFHFHAIFKDPALSTLLRFSCGQEGMFAAGHKCALCRCECVNFVCAQRYTLFSLDYS